MHVCPPTCTSAPNRLHLVRVLLPLGQTPLYHLPRYQCCCLLTPHREGHTFSPLAMVELNDPTHKLPRFLHSPNADLSSSTRTHTSNSSHDRPDLYKSSSLINKAHLSNGDTRPPSTKPHSSNGDNNRAKTHSLHADLNRPRLFSKLPWLWLPFKRKFFILSSFLVLLVLAFVVFPTARVYPALKHPFLVRPNEALSFPLLHFFHRRQLNQTILALAKVDLGEHAERMKVNSILDGTWSRPSAQSRYSFLHDRYRHDDHYSDRLYERRRPSRLRDQRLPIQLSSPRYAPFWAQFRSSLRMWVQNKHYDPHIMARLLNTVKDPIDKHYMKKPNHTVALGKPYKTCAVVGNSGILLNQSHGSLIDRHDMVMRLNNARISGFEQHVGSKTTLSFVNSNILHTCARRSGCYCHPYGKDVPIVMYICQVVHLMDVAMCSSTQQAPIIVTDARFDTLCARIVKYYSLKRFVETTGRRLEDWSDTHEGPLFHYSSGMQAVLLAVGVCEKVSIFGFGKSERSKHHYHTSQKAELRLHDYGAEYDFYTDLVIQNAQLIPFLNEAGFSLPSVHIYW
ncbi:hypothetical protein GOP47_0017054 [Adiantum capillus-veneris]|uniref:Uncharacterized protein n=1 Tax=Adiantum capillus-veneris TaxID=13818 RepID=A0A9D4ZB94_ADICA|nr:hypothetical protein GOP47_0017054 [Adiantum capillus-veneris]